MIRYLFSLLVCCSILSCGGSSDVSDLDDIIDVIEDEPERKPIDTNSMGVNSFFNDARFGSISSQYSEIKSTLRLKYIRVLLNWSDAVQSSPGAAIKFGFYDNILRNIPEGVDVLVVLAGLPTWMSASGNWIDGDVRRTFAESWVQPVVARYADVSRIVGFQIWNEPNEQANPDNYTLDIVNNGGNYVDMLKKSAKISRELAPGKLIVNAATTAINQNFPETLEYNREMKSSGIEDVVDVFAVHIYGKQFENYVRGKGVEDFFKGFNKVVWATESGEQGFDKQLAYVEQVWPFIKEKIPQLERIYYYQFAEDSAATSTYGLKNLTEGLTISDLYVFLRDRP